MNAKTKARLIISAIILAAVVFRGTVGPLVMTVIFLAAVLGALLFLPAFIGAVAGATVRDVLRGIRHWQHAGRGRS